VSYHGTGARFLGRYVIALEVGDELFSCGERFFTRRGALKYCTYLNGISTFYVPNCRYVFEHIPRTSRRL